VDERVPWVSQLSEITDGHKDSTRLDESHLTGQAFGELFTVVERALFPFARPASAEGILELMKSRSYYIRATPEGKAAMERDILHLLREHPDLGRDEFELPYVTLAYKAHKR
jgi:hypothetical protein